MSKRILPFRVKALSFTAPKLSDPPRPVIAQPGDRFIRVDVVDDLYIHAGFSKGFIFVAQLDKLITGHVHYVELDGYGLLARLTEDSQSTIHVEPLDPTMPARAAGRAELLLFGAVIEMYPRGLTGSRWIYCPREGEGLAGTLYEFFRNQRRVPRIALPLKAETGLAAFREYTGMMRWQTDEHGYYLLSDEMRLWISLLGCDPEAWAGWGWIDFLHPEDKDPYLFRWSEAIETGKPYLNQGRICIQGIWLYMVVSANPIRDASGRIVGWEGFMHIELVEERRTA